MYEKEKELAIHITNAINGSFNNQAFAEEMAKQHRALQYDFTHLCWKWFSKCAIMYHEGNYDGRNEYACKSADMALKALDKPTYSDIRRAEQCLIDNGIDADEASTVLQALDYILMDRELYEGGIK